MRLAPSQCGHELYRTRDKLNHGIFKSNKWITVHISFHMNDKIRHKRKHTHKRTEWHVDQRDNTRRSHTLELSFSLAQKNYSSVQNTTTKYLFTFPTIEIYSIHVHASLEIGSASVFLCHKLWITNCIYEQRNNKANTLQLNLDDTLHDQNEKKNIWKYFKTTKLNRRTRSSDQMLLNCWLAKKILTRYAQP